jgi:GTP pyrophosphokinase
VGALSFASLDELLICVGYGKKLPEQIIHKLYPDLKPVEEDAEKKESTISKIFTQAAKIQQQKKSTSPVRVAGIDDNVLIRFGKCCNPLPGDDIIGFISRGRGVTIHKIDCHKVLESDANRAVDVIWEKTEGAMLRHVKIKIICLDKPGLLNRMSQTITNCGININSVNIRVNAEKRATGIFDLEVKDRQQLVGCLQTLQNLDDIISVERI